MRTIDLNSCRGGFTSPQTVPLWGFHIVEILLITVNLLPYNNGKVWNISASTMEYSKQTSYRDEDFKPVKGALANSFGAPAETYGKRYIHTTSDARRPVSGLITKVELQDRPVRDYEPAQSVQQNSPLEDEPADNETPLRASPISTISTSEPESPSYEQEPSRRPSRFSTTDIQLHQLYPEQVQLVQGGTQANHLHQSPVERLPMQQVNQPVQQQYQHVLIPAPTHVQAVSQPRTVYSLATAPGGLKSFLRGQSVATEIAPVGRQPVSSTNTFDGILSAPSSGGSLTSASNPMHSQVHPVTLNQNPVTQQLHQRDLLNQPQTLQLTAIPSIGYNGNGALVRLGPGAFAPVNGLYNGWNNNFLDPFGRQMFMVNADRRELDWNFWIWPLLALVTLPLILGALFVPIFLKTIVVLIQVLQSLGLLLPISNAVGASLNAASTNQLEDSVTQT